MEGCGNLQTARAACWFEHSDVTQLWYKNVLAFRLGHQAMLIAVPMGASQTLSLVTQTVDDQITSHLGQRATSEMRQDI